MKGDKKKKRKSLLSPEEKKMFTLLTNQHFYQIFLRLFTLELAPSDKLACWMHLNLSLRNLT